MDTKQPKRQFIITYNADTEDGFELSRKVLALLLEGESVLIPHDMKVVEITRFPSVVIGMTAAEREQMKIK